MPLKKGRHTADFQKKAVFNNTLLLGSKYVGVVAVVFI
jgi:hypothetical protein